MLGESEGRSDLDFRWPCLTAVGSGFLRGSYWF